MYKVIEGKICTRAELAEILGVALTTVDSWVRDGMPVRKRGGKGIPSEYDSGEVIRWWIARELSREDKRTDLDELRGRKLELENSLRALQLEKERGTVAPLEQIERGLAKAFSEVRAHMRNIPARAVTSLIGETDETKFKAVLLAEIDQALTALADMDLVGEEGEEA